MQNTGSTTWSSDVGYALGSQNPAGNTTWGMQAVGFNADVIPRQQTTFVFTVTAPAAGSYSMQWQMKQGTQSFGSIASAPVTVTGSEPPPSTPGVETITYIHTDGLGSPVARTDGAGALVSRTSYEPYGRTATGATPTIGFTGHVNDADTGLVYMQQRYYDPVAGRFLSVDPVTTDASTGSSFNRYVYANNSPYKYVDPDGRQERAAQNFGDSVSKAHGWSGFEQKQSAQDIYEKSSMAARETGLPGAHNGPQDAARHCIGSAETTRQYGAVIAGTLGEANEKKGDLTYNQTSEEKSMDRHNNFEGIKIGSDSKSFKQVVEQCVVAVTTGKTVNSLPPSDQQHPYTAKEVDTK